MSNWFSIALHIPQFIAIVQYSIDRSNKTEHN